MTQIRKAAVLGAGTMGSGIAAQIANSGVPVRLYDLDRDTAERALSDLPSRKPAPLMSSAVAGLIEPAGFDRIDLIADCDWIVEAIVEKLEPKQALYRQVAEHCKPDALLTSNTSGILLRDLTSGLPEDLAARTLITHFFNPPRYMGLVELVSGPGTRADATATIRAFCSEHLGKVVVDAKDTPCFIANRIGVLNLVAGLRFAAEVGLTVEEADAVAGRPMGFPGTGLFGLLDLVGFDVVELVCQNLREQLPAGDPARPYLDLPSVGRHMLDQGLVGRKAGAGFYRFKPGSRDQEVMDLVTHEYRERRPVELTSARARDPAELLGANDSGGEFAWRLLSTVLVYAAQVAGEMADDILAVDAAMREGFSWRWGPFELLDRIGPAAVAQRMAEQGRQVPPLLAAVAEAGGTFYKSDAARTQFWQLAGGYKEITTEGNAWTIAQMVAGTQPLQRNDSATLWDIGDGVALLELHSKMNAIDDNTVAALRDAADRAGRDFKALVIGTDGKHFSVGANLQVMLDAARQERWQFLDEFIGGLQRALMALKLAPCPVVMATHGYALGGGCELALHGDHIQAHAEFNIGLVEMRVGLIPAGGGCKEMLLRQRGRGGVEAAFDLIARGVTSSSALHARELGILREGDGITMNRGQVLADARAAARALARGYVAPEPGRVTAQPALAAKLRAGLASLIDTGDAAPHDAAVAQRLAWVLTGGDAADGTTLSEFDLLNLERAAFLELLALPGSQERMAHMLKTGKPLRN